MVALATVVLSGCAPRETVMTEETVVVTVAPRAAVGGEASGSTGPSVLAEGEVALYEDVDYGGREWIVRGDTASFAATAGLDDVASSVRVGPGAAVSLYETSSFEGRRIWIDADTPSLVGSTLGNDAASSARVRASLAPARWPSMSTSDSRAASGCSLPTRPISRRSTVPTSTSRR